MADPANTASLMKILERAWNDKASDMHLREDEPVILRIDGELIPLADTRVTAEDIRDFLRPMMRADQIRRFEDKNELDFSCDALGLCRLRINLYMQRQHVCATIRLLPGKIPRMDDIYLPKACSQFVALRKGLVLVTGPTGSGKSTTLYAALNGIKASGVNVITVEDRWNTKSTASARSRSSRRSATPFPARCDTSCATTRM